MSSLNPEQTLSGNPTVLFPFPEEKEQRLAIERKKNGTEGGGGGVWVISIRNILQTDFEGKNIL